MLNIKKTFIMIYFFILISENNNGYIATILGLDIGIS